MPCTRSRTARDQAGRIDDGREPEPAHQDHIENISEVSEVDVDGAEKKAQTEDKDRLKENDDGKGEIRPLRIVSKDPEKRKGEDEGDEKVQQTGEDNGERQDLPRKVDGLDQIAAVRKGGERNHDARRKVTPGKVATHKEHGKALDSNLHDVIKCQGVDDDD